MEANGCKEEANDMQGKIWLIPRATRFSYPTRPKKRENNSCTTVYSYIDHEHYLPRIIRWSNDKIPDHN